VSPSETPSPRLPLLERARAAGEAPALIAPEGAFSYTDLMAAAERGAAVLLDGHRDLAGTRVAVMVPPGFRYTAVQWATWAAGGISVPLALTNPLPELEYVVDDCAASVIVASDEYRDMLEPVARDRGVPLLDADELAFSDAAQAPLPVVGEDRRCLILYTSGTTGRPKGVTWTHANLEAQLRLLSEAWRWSSQDRILLVLPLHHVHGLVNVLTSALWNQATCHVLPAFDVGRTWELLASGEISVFMAVPTIYRRLITAWPDVADQPTARECLRRMRLMVSGSAALPIPTLEAWRQISGHTLLERYGMTEIGMALSNPYDGPRAPGTVGTPLPTVEVRIVDERGAPVPPGTQGELEVKGPSVFLEYWGKPEATGEAFHDGWFRTGDVVVAEAGVHRIVGRQSVDIIKTGGEKVSALEIEAVLRDHPAVGDCAVVGVDDEEWGELVAGLVVAEPGTAPDPEELRDFAKARLAPAKVPRRIEVADELPRNAMGKVLKPEVRRILVDG
jgi:malonyl-CoA/methylmalonyl-CoA synthetase